MSTLKAFFQAATAFFRAWPLWKRFQLELEINGISDEIHRLGTPANADDLLRIEQLNKQREQLRALRSSFSDLAGGD